MRLLMWILLTVATAASVASSCSWVGAQHHAKLASAQLAQAQTYLASWQFADQLQAENLQDQLHNDQMRVRNDEVQLEIASLLGKPVAALQAAKRQDEALLSSDEYAQQLHDQMAVTGSPEHTVRAAERVAAIQASLQVYSAVVERDQHWVYPIGVLWLAFGFAAALSVRRPAAILA